MTIGNLTPEQQEKAKAAKTEEELAELAREEGSELADEGLNVSGGIRFTAASSCEDDLYCQQDHHCRDLALGCGTKCEALM